MGNILANNREWTQHQNEEEDADQSQHQHQASSSSSSPPPKTHAQTAPSKHDEYQDENRNPSTPVVESAGRLIRRKLSAAIGACNTPEYTRVASMATTPSGAGGINRSGGSEASTPVAASAAAAAANSKLVLGANFDPRSPTTGIVRTPIVIANVGAGNENVKKGGFSSALTKRLEN